MKYIWLIESRVEFACFEILCNTFNESVHSAQYNATTNKSEHAGVATHSQYNAVVGQLSKGDCLAAVFFVKIRKKIKKHYV